MKPTQLSLQFADTSIKPSRGVIEDVLIRVEHLIFPMGFVVLDMDEDVEVAFILSRLFFITIRAVIDIGDGKLTLRVYEEALVVKAHSVSKQPMSLDDI